MPASRSHGKRYEIHPDAAVLRLHCQRAANGIAMAAWRAGALGDEDRDRPTLSIYLPPVEDASGAGVVICPGGGYGALSMEKEGSQIAKWLNERGIAGFVLKY